MSSPRPARANRGDGCLVCGGWEDEMVTLAEHGAVVCRPCVTRIGRVIVAMSPSVVARLWPVSRSEREGGRDAPPPHGDVDTDESATHLDLAVAYDEMGLVADAVREAAMALGERAPLAVASRALPWIFSRGRAAPDALGSVAGMLRRG